MIPPLRKNPEQEERELINEQLKSADWIGQHRGGMSLHAARGVAIRDFKMREPHAFPAYRLSIDEKAVGRSRENPPVTRFSESKPKERSTRKDFPTTATLRYGRFRSSV